MIYRHNHHGTPWVDLENPTSDEIHAIMTEFRLDPRCAQQLMEPALRSKTEVFGATLFMVLHFPDHPAQRTDLDHIEIDFVIGANFLITVRYGAIDSLSEFQTASETHQLMHADRTDITAHPLHIVHDMLRLLYSGMRDEIAVLAKDLLTIETEIFKGHEDDMVRRISQIRRAFIDIKHSTRFHEDVLKSAQTSIIDLYGAVHDTTGQNIMNQYYKMHDILEGNLELVRELRETNDSLLTAKNNDVMKRLTLMAFITFPLTLVATVLLAHDSPAVFHGPRGFWTIVIILGVLLVLMHRYFKIKKWI